MINLTSLASWADVAAPAVATGLVDLALGWAARLVACVAPARNRGYLEIIQAPAAQSTTPPAIGGR